MSLSRGPRLDRPVAAPCQSQPPPAYFTLGQSLSRPSHAQPAHTAWQSPRQPEQLLCVWTSGRRSRSAPVAARGLPGDGEVADVEEVEGVRVLLGEAKRPFVEYLIKWKDGTPSTWEPAFNISENLVRDYEDRWWKCCREGDVDTMRRMLRYSQQVLPKVTNDNRRSALHFAAAIGNVPATALLGEAGADIDLGDRDGYTPLHMAVGYSHTATAAALLGAGANPEAQDRNGRSVLGLVDFLRDSMPLSPAVMPRRMALEAVADLLADALFEEVAPRAVLEDRANPNGTRDYLVQWPDGREDTWVAERDVAEDLVEDFRAGLEYAEASELVRDVRRGDEREFLVRWADGAPESWEPEDHLPSSLVSAYDASRAERLAASPALAGRLHAALPANADPTRHDMEPKPANQPGEEDEAALADADTEDAALARLAQRFAPGRKNGAPSAGASRRAKHSNGVEPGGSSTGATSGAERAAQGAGAPREPASAPAN